MSEIKSYVDRATHLIARLRDGYDSSTLFDELGVISTNPNDAEENGDASIILTYGGPTVYLTVGDTVDFHYRFGEETYDETFSDVLPDEVDALRRFVEETAS